MKRLMGVLLLVAATPLGAQEVGFSVGVRGDAGIPTGSDFGEDAEVGFGFGVEAVAQFTPVIGAYGGYSNFSFGVDTEGDDVDADYTDSGFAVGGHFNIPTQDGPVAPWVRAGAIYHMIEMSASDGSFSIEIESKRRLGFEVGAGLDFALGETGAFVVQPAARYRAYTTEIDVFGESAEGDVNYFTVGLGVAYMFGGN